MDAIRRLTNAGVQLESAIETVSWYRQQGDDYGLEKFIQEVETKAGKEKPECTE